MPTRRPLPRGLFRLAFLLALPAGALGAQGTSEQTVWFTYSGEHPLTERTALVAEAQVRRGDALQTWRNLLTRVGLSWRVGDAVRVSAGYGYQRTYADGAEIAATYPEHRLWQIATFGHDVGALAVTHRARLEERWIAGESFGAPGTWAQADRARYQLRVAMPLPGSDGRLTLGVADEIFASFGGDAGALAVDQNRAAIGVGYRLTPTLRVEAGYLNRATVAHSRLTTRDHVVQLTFASSAPLHRTRRASTTD